MKHLTQAPQPSFLPMKSVVVAGVILLLLLQGCEWSTPESAAGAKAPGAVLEIPPIKGELAGIHRLIEDGDTGPARIRLRRWMDTHGEDARALFLFGLAYHSERRYARSAEWFQRSLESTPVYPPAAHFLGWSNYYLGNVHTSSEAFRRHLEMTPGEGDSHYGLGLLALDAGNLVEAEVHFNEALELQQEQLDRGDGVSKALVRLAELDELHGNRDAARLHLEDAVRIDPDRVEAWHRLARCCRRQGDEAAAVEAEQRHAEAVRRSRPRTGFPE